MRGQCGQQCLHMLTLNNTWLLLIEHADEVSYILRRWQRWRLAIYALLLLHVVKGEVIRTSNIYISPDEIYTCTYESMRYKVEPQPHHAMRNATEKNVLSRVMEIWHYYLRETRNRYDADCCTYYVYYYDRASLMVWCVV